MFRTQKGELCNLATNTNFASKTILILGFDRLEQNAANFADCHLGDVDDVGGQGRAHEGVRLLRVVQEAELQGEEPLRAQADALHRLPLFPVPHRQRVAVQIRHLRWVEALRQCIGDLVL